MTSHDGPLRDMQFSHALDYVSSFMSVKVFPWTWQLYSANVTALVRAAALTRGVPVVILTRKHADAYRSFMTAQEKGEWNTAKVSERQVQADAQSEKKEEDSEEFTKFKTQRDEYFATMDDMLKSNSIPYDRVDYDEIKDVKWIHLPNAQCYVSNCNDWATR